MEMTLNNANVFNCSVKNYTDLLKYYGTGDFAEISMIKLIYKYACYAPTEAALQRLDAMISEVQRGSRLICKDSINGNFFPEYISPVLGEVFLNKAPTVDDYTVDILSRISVNTDNSGRTTEPIYTYVNQFVQTDFQNNFSDADSHGPGEIVILTLPDPAGGRLLYNKEVVIVNQVITDASLLEFWKIIDTAYSLSFTFRIADDYVSNPAWSNIATITMTGLSATDNSSATIDDEAYLVDNQAITVITSAMFTTYLDADGDPLDAIRVDSVSIINQGEYRYQNVAVVAGQVILASELDAGDFVHYGANVNTITTDSIDVSVRDSGSLIWVS